MVLLDAVTPLLAKCKLDDWLCVASADSAKRFARFTLKMRPKKTAADDVTRIEQSAPVVSSEVTASGGLNARNIGAGFKP